MQGFTTVRDAGGADYASAWCWKRATSRTAPAGLRPLHLATGGTVTSAPLRVDRPDRLLRRHDRLHRRRPDEVRRAARENIAATSTRSRSCVRWSHVAVRRARQTQFTVAEMRAAVEEAQAVGKYVLSHGLLHSAVRRAIEAGVRSIEHGNLIREARRKPSRTRTVPVRPW